jgi:hypothetical protein
VIREEGGGRVDVTRTALEGFAKSLKATDEIVIEVTGNTMALVRVLSPFVLLAAIGDIHCFSLPQKLETVRNCV